MVLEKIHRCNDIKKIPYQELPILASEIREFLIDRVSECGGHLASNLGTVELTMALHLCLNLPEDKIIWDVGHQAYTHKILTGRKEGFYHLRKQGGLSGFPKRAESDCDAFDTGHSSTSISAGIGMVCARELDKESYHVVSVIGDGSMTGGMAYEAMNNAASLDSNFIIVLNDNDMSISKNVGGMSRYLSGMRTQRGYNHLKENVTQNLSRIPGIGNSLVSNISKAKNGIKQLMIPGMLFENMGLTYLGPVDGHDLDALIQVLNDAKKLNRAVLVHVRTQKGRGYQPALERPDKFHGVGPFCKEDGSLLSAKKRTYTEVFSDVMCRLAQTNEKVVAITAAMAQGTGLTAFEKIAPNRFFDVGIAEEHAVTFAAGLAMRGYRPVVAIYSSFLQRAYDQMMQDVCLQNMPVVFAVDRAGLVGDDGETHQGVFDLAYLRMMPNMTVFVPKNEWEMEAGLLAGIAHNGPFAIRYPKTAAYKGLLNYKQPIQIGKAEILEEGEEIALLAYGTMVEEACKTAEYLRKEGLNPTVVNMRFVKPLDRACLENLCKTHTLFVTMEEGACIGGIGEEIGAFFAAKNQMIQHLSFGMPDYFIEHGSISSLKQKLGLEARQMAEVILEQKHRTNERNR